MYKIVALFVVITCIKLPDSFGQRSLCQNCYIWDFSNEDGERNQTTRLLSNDIEDLLSQYDQCTIIQRSKFAKLQEQILNEESVQSVSLGNPDISYELKLIKAQTVIFGLVGRDFQGNVSLRLSFENLKTSQVKSNTIFIVNNDFYDFEKRRQKLRILLNNFLGIELEENGNKTNTPIESKSSNVFENGLPQTWLGTLAVEGPQIGDMIMLIEYANDGVIRGKINWPTFGNCITYMEGEIIERDGDFMEESKWRLLDKKVKKKDGFWFRFMHPRMLQDGDGYCADLSASFYCHVSNQGEIRGIWFRGSNAVPTGDFQLSLERQ